MRTKKDIEELHAKRELEFGYVDITQFECPPFVMFTNRSDCGMCSAMLLDRLHEPQSMRLWSQLAQQATSIFDIGTRSGEYTLVAAALRADIPIISCEPNPDGFARLVVNLLANDVKNVIPRRVAVADQDALAAFSWVPKWFGHISSGGRIGANPHPQATNLTVEAKKLSTIAEGIDIGNRPLMKIDVEGAELMVFGGMGRVLEAKPDIILECFHSKHCDLITEMTRPLGYNYFKIGEVDGSLVQRDQLYPADLKSQDYNQLLSTRSLAEIMELGAESKWTRR